MRREAPIHKILLWRKALFYLFALAYGLVCPLLILYALGYLFAPGTEGGIVKTGLISIATVPSGASVYLDARRYTQKSPTVIRDLLPGDYEVTLAMKNAELWKRTVSVEAERATVLDKIVLLPKEFPFQNLLSDEYRDLVPTQAKRFLVLTKGMDLADFSIYDRKRGKETPLVSEVNPLRSARVLSVYSMDESDEMLLDVQLGLWGEEKFFWIAPDLPVGVKDVTSLFSQRPEAIDWDFRQPQFLFTLKDGTLNRLDVASGAVYPKIAENIRGWGLSDRKVYFLDKNGSLLRMEAEGKTAENVIKPEETALSHLLSSSGDFFRVQVLESGRMLFWGKRGALLTNRPPYWLVENGVVGIQEDLRTKKVLVWRSDRVGILNFLEGLDAEKPVETAEIDWAFTKGRNIRQAFWAYEGSNVLFVDRDKLYFLEEGAYAAGSPRELFQVKRGSSVIYREKSGEIYYLDKSTGRLCVTRILPQKELLPA